MQAARKPGPTPLTQSHTRLAAVSRPAARTIVSWPAPPSAGSKSPPSSQVVAKEPAKTKEQPSAKEQLSAKEKAKPAATQVPRPVPVPRPGMKSPSVAPVSAVRAPLVAHDLAEPELLADDDILEDAAPALPRAASLPPPMRDPLERLRESVGELEYLATPWQAAGVCAAALAKALGARAVIVHTCDKTRREIRAIAVESLTQNELLGEVTPIDGEPELAKVVATGGPATLRLDGPGARPVPARLRGLAPKHAIVAAPAMGHGKCVAVIEVVDGGGPVTAACAYAATQLARFLSASSAAGSGVRRIG